MLKKSPSRAIGINDKELDNKTVKINIRWDGYKCKPIVTNNGNATIRLKNIILFDVVEHGLSPNTPIYGEGFQKLSQTAGTLKNPVDLGGYKDRIHYRIPEPDNMRTVYNLFSFGTDSSGYVLLAFTSVRQGGRLHPKQ